MALAGAVQSCCSWPLLVVLLTDSCTFFDTILQYTFQGRTMETTFAVMAVGERLSAGEAEHLTVAIDDQLASLDGMMSTYVQGRRS